jgi:hypothetical protein
MVLYDYQSHQPALLAFCEIAGDELIVSKGDPAASLPIGDTSDNAILTAYFAYHLYLRVELLTLHTVPHMLQTVGPDIRSSMACVERAVSRLGILNKGSEARILWSSMRQKITKYVEIGDRHYDRVEIGEDFNDLGRLIMNELSRVVSWRLTQLWYYAQNLQAVIAATFLGDSIPLEAASTFLRISNNMGRDCMSEEYNAVLNSVQEVVQHAVTRSLTDEEVAFVHEKSVWQSEHFLRHFRAEAFSPGVQCPWQALKSLDSGFGIDGELLQAIKDGETILNRSSDDKVHVLTSVSKHTSGVETVEEMSSSVVSDTVSKKQENDTTERNPSPDPDNLDMPSLALDFSTQKLESMNNFMKLDDLFRLMSSKAEAQSLHHQLNACVIHQQKTVKVLQQERQELRLVLEAASEDVIRFSLQSEIEDKEEDILWAESHLKRLHRLKKDTEERMQELCCHRMEDFSSEDLAVLLRGMLSDVKCDGSLLHGVTIVSLDLLHDIDVVELSGALQLRGIGENERDIIRERLKRWM